MSVGLRISSIQVIAVGDDSLVAHDPDHPVLPARVSVLMLPDLGVEARLLVPCDASAVTGRTLDACASCVLRLFRPMGRLRSIVKARTSL